MCLFTEKIKSLRQFFLSLSRLRRQLPHQREPWVVQTRNFFGALDGVNPEFPHQREPWVALTRKFPHQREPWTVQTRSFLLSGSRDGVSIMISAFFAEI